MPDPRRQHVVRARKKFPSPCTPSLGGQRSDALEWIGDHGKIALRNEKDVPMTALYEQMILRPEHDPSRPQSGSLMVSDDSVVFYGEKQIIPLNAIRRSSLDDQGWLHIEYGDDGHAALSDASWRGAISALTRLPGLARALRQHQQ